MEELNSYNIKGLNFGLWLTRIIFLLITTILVLLLVLHINETVAITKGEIVAFIPQIDYKAPFEAQLIKVYVKEGQRINKQDTLVTINNNALRSEYLKKKAQAEYLQKRISSTFTLQQALEDKKKAILKDSTINVKKLRLNIKEISNEIKSLDEQCSLQKERLLSVDEKYIADSMLFKNDKLSGADFYNIKDAYLFLRENISKANSQRQKEITEKNFALSNFEKEQNILFVNQVQLTENIQLLLQSKNELENQFVQTKESIKELEVELNKGIILAEDSGIINFVFNTQKVSNLLSKGDLLVSIAPNNIAYYAKATIPQKDARYIKTGLQARLKLDAYYQFEHELIQGKVSYMTERNENEKFYALIQLPKSDMVELKSGYTFQGQIILQQMPLYKFIVKKIFKRLDKK